jgi:hypothetical protein
MDSLSTQTNIEENLLKEANDEVFRKVGRNVLLFQQMEQALKALVSTSNISGYASELKKKQEIKAESVKTQTMGQLVGQYIDNNSPDQVENNEPENLKEVFISVQSTIQIDGQSHEEEKELMASLVAERNTLVHHFLSTFDSTSMNSCIDAQARLDKQAERVRNEINNFRATLTTFIDMRKSLSEFCTSKEFKDYLIASSSQQSTLANLLSGLAQTKARKDGWMVLNKAVSIINTESPEELKNIKENHGCKKLKDMMIKTGLFDFYEEQTAKGGSRILYRLNQG